MIRMGDNASTKKDTMHYVDGRQPTGWPRKMLCNAIRADMKSLNISNEDANNKALWGRAIKPEKLTQHAGVLPAHVSSGRETTSR